jgi:hypothetical protein
MSVGLDHHIAIKNLISIKQAAAQLDKRRLSLETPEDDH